MSVSTLKLDDANELATSICEKLGPRVGEPGTLVAAFNEMKQQQAQQHGVSEECTNLSIQCPKEKSKLVCVIDKNVRQLISYDLPVAFQKLMEAKNPIATMTTTACNCTGFKTLAFWCISSTCLDQTGDITRHNRSQFSGDKTVLFTKGKITRTLQAVGCDSL